MIYLLKEKITYPYKFIRKIKDNKIIILGLAILLSMIVLSPIALADSDFATTAVAKIIRSFGQGISSLVTETGGTIDKLVYNVGNDGSDLGLTMLKDNDVSKYIVKIYINMRYIGACLMVSIGAWITIDFVKFSTNPQHKAVLLERLKLLIIGIILLTTMPFFVDLLFKVNAAFVEIFKTIGIDSSKINVKDGLLIETFKKSIENDDNLTILGACIYTITAFLNLFFLFFYFSRDLAITFLFLIFPLVVFNFAYKKQLTVDWCKQMFSNIITQSIHALIMCVVIGIFDNLIGNGKDPNMYDQLFCLTAFAYVLPFTGQIKRLLGIEGDMGAANHMAGLGALMGGVMLAKGSIGSMKKSASMMSEGFGEFKDAKANERMFDSSDNGSGNEPQTLNSSVTDTPVTSSSLTKTQLLGEKRTALKKVARGLGGVGVGTYTGLGSAIGGLAFGSRGAMGLGALGASVGNSVGSTGGELAYSGSSRGLSKASDLSFGENIRPDTVGLMNETGINGAKDLTKLFQGETWKKMGSNISNDWSSTKQGFEDGRNSELVTQKQNEITGLDNDVIEGTPYQEQERAARLKKMRYESLGLKDKAFRSYAKYTPKKLNQEAIDKTIESGDLSNTHLYTDKDMSILYNTSSDDEREILWTGTGNPNLTTPTLQNVELGSEEITIPIKNRERINAQARTNVETTFGSYDTSNKEHSESYKKEVNRLVESETAQMETIRQATGISNINVKASIENYEPVSRNIPNEVDLRQSIQNQLASTKDSLIEQQKAYDNMYDIEASSSSVIENSL